MANFLDAIKNAADVVSNVAAGAVDPNKAVGSSNTGNVFTDAVADAVNTAVNAAPKRNAAPVQPAYAYWNENSAGPEYKPQRRILESTDPSEWETGTGNRVGWNLVANGTEPEPASSTAVAIGEESGYEQPDLEPDASASDKSIDELKQDLEKEQSDKLDLGKDLAANLLTSAYTQSGIDPYSNPHFEEDLEALYDEDDINSLPGLVKEQQRRFANGTGRISMNPEDWNIFGLTSQNRPTQTAKGIYDHYFGIEDENGVRNEDAISTKLTNTNPFGVKIVDENIIDDGASPTSREAMYMTGEQYIKYRNEFGIPGRDVRYIDPNAIYSKQDEMENYGFIPYLSSNDSLDAFHDETIAPAVSNMFNNLADLRRKNTDYSLNYDGEQYSGKDFARNVRLWNQRVSAAGNIEPVYNIEEADENAIPLATVATDENGNKYYAPNQPIEILQYDDGTIRWRFNDNPGDDWVFADEEDQKASLSHEVAKGDEWVGAWQNVEPLVLDSGQVIRADKASDLWSNLDKYADYGPLDWNKPSVTDPIEEGGWAPWFADMVLSSAPYFYMPAAQVKAVADATNEAKGFKPGYQDYLNGTYSLISENPTWDQQLTSSLSSIAMPWTEQLWGPMGQHAFANPISKVLKKSPAIASIMGNPAYRYLEGITGEGLEEIMGNVVEELHNNGLDWYANDAYERDADGNIIYDENGKPREAFDSQGRAIKEETGALDRMANFFEDAPLAFLGGASLGGVLGAGNIPSYYKEYKENKANGGEPLPAESMPVDIGALLSTMDFDEDDMHYYNS